MTQYRRKPTPAQAWQFNGQPRDEWPEFVAEYTAHTVMGALSVGLSTNGLLMIPVAGEESAVAVNYGDWAVLEGKVLSRVRNSEFNDKFEVAED